MAGISVGVLGHVVTGISVGVLLFFLHVLQAWLSSSSCTFVCVEVGVWVNYSTEIVNAQSSSS